MWQELSSDLERLLRLRAVPFGMKLFASVDEMQAIPKIRRPQSSVHTLDQIVGQAARLGWTVGITAEDLVGDQCRSVVGLGGQDDAWFSGQHMVIAVAVAFHHHQVDGVGTYINGRDAHDSP